MSTWSSLHRHTAKCSTPHVCFRARCYGRAPVQRGTCAAGHGRRLPLLTARPSQGVDRPSLLPAYYSVTLECVWPLLPSRVVVVHAPCVLPSAPVESTARGRHHRRALRVVHARACARAMATGGVSRRQAAVGTCRGIGRLSVCRARARTVLAKSGADHLVSYHRWRRLAHHRLDGLSHCDPCRRIHTGCGRVHTGCDRK